MSDDDYKNTQCELLNTRLEAIENPELAGNTLSELIYTASETGLIDFAVYEDALTIWKLVELAKTLGDNCPQELRM